MGLTGFDCVTNQVHVPVKFLTCGLFLKKTQELDQREMYTASNGNRACKQNLYIGHKS